MVAVNSIIYKLRLGSVLLPSFMLAVVGCGGKSTESKESTPTPAVTPAPELAADWHNAADLFIEGKGWETETPFVRLPKRAQELVTEKVWVQAQYSAGLAVRFTSNSTKIHAKWPAGAQLRNMPAIGVSGLDLYVNDPKGAEKNQWTWVGVGKPDNGLTIGTIATFPTSEEREFILFLPLYSVCSSLEIGVEPGSTFSQPVTTRTQKPIVFYGTSIVQGGCASRTGMAHTSILRRWLNHEVINLGFSGSGSMEIEMADLLGELDASVFVIDTLPNTTTAQMKERYVPFINRLREHKPNVPLVLVGHIMGDNLPDRNEQMELAIAELESAGLKNFVYIPGRELIAGQEEATVDGVHPTDLGFLRMAEVHYPVLKELLIKTGK